MAAISNTMPSRRSTSTKQTSAGTSAEAKSPAEPTGTGPAIRIRMYRQGLGDCFLVTFNPGGKEVHMLVDCGSLGATTTSVKLGEVVADILQVTKGHIHLLVATHEHKDHVSAFYDLQNQFKQLRVENVWLAWTENPADPLAQSIAKYKADLGAALAPVSQVMAGQNVCPGAAELGMAIQDILGFAGDPNAPGAFAKTVNEAMNIVRLGLGAKVRFHNPGEEAIEPAWFPGFRFYVLGPPRLESALHDTGETEGSDLYSLAAQWRSVASLAAGVQAGGMVAQEEDMPFDVHFRLQPSDPLIAGSLRDYMSEEDAWRRIDYDWLHAAADLALQLDSLTNNTSLVLAIERISDGKVLLFPADAQEGNWLSWHDPAMKWIVKEGSITRIVTAADLLARTVFYKVGHHASHNATARVKGLELMQRENELIAFIPVDRAVALTRNPKNSWKMPARPLYRRLLEKCQGRVLRSDIGWADDARNAEHHSVEKEFAGLADAPTWAKWKQSQQEVKLTTAPLYFEVTL